jgi:predicted DsbA family dithiol-disulfide isomerase
VVEQLKAEYGKDNVEVEWLPYLLRPSMPEGGEPLPEYVQQKRGQLEGRLKQMAAAGGLDFVQFERSPNPRRAHECTEYAREHGKGELFHQRAFDYLYGQGKDISDWAILRAAASEAGLDPDDMQRRVQAGEYREAVDSLIAEAQAIGVQGVPFYIVNNKYGISGAQPVDVFRRAINMSRQASSE